MREYEGMFIIKPDMNKDELDKTVSSIENSITKNGGRVKTYQKWARRKLAYSIKRYKEGEYYLCEFEAEPKSIMTLDGGYRLNENILRSLITVKEK